MTLYQFMVSAFYTLCGIACIGLAAVVLYAVVLGIYKGIKGIIDDNKDR